MRALKVRNIVGDYFALSELHGLDVSLPGATRFASLSACPWLSYFAPLALRHISRLGAATYFAPLALRHISRLWRCDIFRAFGAATYFAPLALRILNSDSREKYSVHRLKVLRLAIPENASLKSYDANVSPRTCSGTPATP